MDNVVMGNLCQDPVLRQPHRTGQPVARFTVAVNKWRRVGLEYVQRTPVFHRVVCFGPLAENVSNSLRKGMEVVVVGEWVDDSYSDDQGQRRVQCALEARTVGPTLRKAVAQVRRVERRTDTDELALAKPDQPTPVTASPSPPSGPPGAGAAGHAETAARGGSQSARASIVGAAGGGGACVGDAAPVGAGASSAPAATLALVPARGKHELITEPADSAELAPVAEPAGRRRGGMHRRKEAQPESAVARAG